MKTNRTIEIILVVVTLLCLVAGIVSLVMSIMGKGNWFLTLSLGLIFLGNLLNFLGTKLRQKKQEKK